MPVRRAAAAVFVVTALLLQGVVLNRLGLPGGAPNLAVAVVLAFALVEGPGPGMVYAFLGGFLADLLSTHTVGRLALVWTVAAYLAGFVNPEPRPGERAYVLPVFAIAVLSGASTLGFAALNVVSSTPHEAVRRIVEQAAAVGVYGVVVGAVVYPVVRLVLTRIRAVAT